MRNFTLFITLIISIWGCGSGIYAPGSKRIYTPHEEKQIITSGGTFMSPSFIAVEGDVSYSPAKHLGVQTFFDLSQKYQSIGLGIGYYRSKYMWQDDYLKRGFHFDGYLGYGIFKAEREPNEAGSFFAENYGYKTKFQDISLNLGLHFTYLYFGADLYFKPHIVDLYEVRLSGDFNSVIFDEYTELASNPFLVYDIGLQLCIGNHDIRLYGGMNLSMLKERLNFGHIDPLSLSAGLNINIENVMNGTFRFL